MKKKTLAKVTNKDIINMKIDVLYGLCVKNVIYHIFKITYKI